MRNAIRACRPAVLCLLVASSIATCPIWLFAGSTGTTNLVTPQGEDSTTALGDFVSDTGGLDTVYSYFIEVPDGTGRLVVDLFDADIGAGGGAEAAAGRDRARTAFNSSVTYSLLDPGGTAMGTQFSTGDTTLPTAGDNAWLTLFDSSVATLGPAPTLVAANLATSSSNTTSVVLAVPGAVAANDLLVATVATDGSPTITPSAVGWTTLDQGSTAGSAAQLAIFYRIATAGEPAGYTFTWGGGQEVVATLAAYRGVDTTSPINISAAATGNSASPAAPTVTTTRGNTLVLRIYGADDDDLSGTPFPSGHTGLFNAQSGNGGGTVSSGAASINQPTAGATGTAAFALSATEQWRTVTVALNPPLTPAVGAPDPGHWEVRVNMGSGDDINHLGMRAHDGNSGSGGTELNVYYHSFNAYGIQDDGVGATGGDRTYTYHPYVTIGCDVEVNDFDWDFGSFGSGSTPLSVTSRSGSFSQSGSTLSGNDAWNTTTFTGFTTDFTAEDYGVWSLDVNINVNNAGGNYGVIYVGNDTTAATPPTAQPEDDTFRVYLPTDAGAAPVKPYIGHSVAHRSGPATLGQGQTTGVTVTVSVVNPTSESITFSAPNNVVTVNVPGSGATFAGINSVEQGTVTSQPSVGGTGNVVWSPGTVAAGDTVLLAYDVDLAPTSAGQRVVVTGTPASNGTTAQFVDETCSGASPACTGTQLTGATYTFGPLCELAATEGATATAAVIGEFGCSDEGGDVVVEWTTIAEAGSVHFEVLRREADGRLVPIQPGPVSALLESPVGGFYRVVDSRADATSSAPLTYWLRETDLRGRRQIYGPFSAILDRQRQHAADHRPLTSAADARVPIPSSAPASKAGDEAVRSGRVGPDARRLSGSVILEIEESGIYFVSATRLARRMGEPLGRVRGWLKSGLFLLERDGTAVAWRESRGPGGQRGLLFYGEAVDSLYSRWTVYRLRGGERGLVMESVSAGDGSAATGDESFPARIDVEQDALALTVLGLDPDSDYWFWRFLRAGDPGADTVARTVSVESATGETGRLAVRLHGGTDTGVAGEHHVQVLLNGTLLGDSVWEGITPHTAVFDVPAGVIVAGGNTVEVVALLDGGVPFSILFLDGFELIAPRRYRTATETLRFSAGANAAALLEGFHPATTEVLEISDPDKPRQVVLKGDLRLALRPGGEYIAVERRQIAAPATVRPNFDGDVLAEGERGEYLVIAPSALLLAAEELAAYRRSRGLGARVVQLELIYDQLNAGNPHPEAIREFLRRAFSEWNDPPRWVVLAGAGSYDYRDLLGFGGNLVPPLLVATPEGLYASDNAIADVVGNDGVPEVAIGRLPVRTADELRAYLDKVKTYEIALDGPATGKGWADRVALLSDAFDRGMDFAAAGSDIVARLPEHYQILPIQLDTESLEVARGRLVSAWQQGLGLVHYTGHGGLDRLAGGGLVVSSDAAALSPTRPERLPVLSAMTCLANRFEVPGFEGVGPALVRQPAGGVVASWAPTGFSGNAGATQLAEHFYAALFSPAEPTLGEAVRRALERLDTLEAPRALRFIYNLLGDPALPPPRVPRPTSDSPGNNGAE